MTYNELGMMSKGLAQLAPTTPQACTPLQTACPPLVPTETFQLVPTSGPLLQLCPLPDHPMRAPF